MSRVIEVVDYDPVRIAAFEKEAAILNAVFDQRVIEVHHIGSTAVPGLDAKSIIDILVVLDHTDDINSFDRAMEDVGYRIAVDTFGLRRNALGMMIGGARHGSIKTRTEQAKFLAQIAASSYYQLVVSFYCGCVVGKGIRSEENRYESPDKKQTVS